MGTETQKEKITAEKVYKALLSGNLLILLGVDKLLPYILVLFVLGWVNIFLNYSIEQTMAKVEKNKKVMEYYRNDYANKTGKNQTAEHHKYGINTHIPYCKHLDPHIHTRQGNNRNQ